MSFKLRQKKAQQKEQQETTVVEDLASEECEEQWVDGLTKNDRAIISTNGWLTDNIVNVAQGLLKQQYPRINCFIARPRFILHCPNSRVHSSLIQSFEHSS